VSGRADIEAAVTCALVEAASLVENINEAREAKLGYLVGRVMAICQCSAHEARAEIMAQLGAA
jgi:Asp-tRNA(Asn)/Glu-tRNA(Gln) amidotransferase B subunit